MRTIDTLPSKSKRSKCDIEDCRGIAISRGLCDKHRKRRNNNGSPHVVQVAYGVGSTFEERFWSRVDTTVGEDKCWEWPCVKEGSYGKVKVGNKRHLAHRVAFRLAHGYDSSLFILHSCDNPRCVNPAHLREGTNADNMQDMYARKRHPVATHWAKLTAEQVKEIRCLLADGHRYESIAEMFSVARSTVYHIHTGRTWKLV